MIAKFLKLNILSKTIFILCYAGIFLVTCTTYTFVIFNLPSNIQPASSASGQISSNQSHNLTKSISGNPTRVVLPSGEIDLLVINGYYDPSSQSWSISNDKAQFATESSKPNNKSGNTFIYGHAIKPVFYNLSKTKAGDRVYVYTDNGYRYSYVFLKTYATNPNDLSVFSYKGSPILTLQTCSGVWSQNRQMYVFKYSGHQKI